METTSTTSRRPFWKRGSYWLIVAIVVLLALAVWFTLDQVCTPSETIPECFGFTA